MCTGNKRQGLDEQGRIFQEEACSRKKGIQDRQSGKNKGTHEQGRNVQKPDLRNYRMMMSGAESEITGVCQGRGKIRLIECNAKCRYLTKLACKGTLLPMSYLSEAPPLL